MILNDKQIKARCIKPSYHNLMTAEQVKALENWKPMISPFLDRQVRYNEKGNKIISKGLSSAGYDVTLARDVKLFTNINSTIIDPLNIDLSCFVDARIQEDQAGNEFVIMPPNSYILGHTVEYFCIPRDILVICVGKSTYARSGAIVNVTPIENSFEGQVVIEVSNASNLPLKLYVNQGISQFIFHETDGCETSYADRNGKYMHQNGVTLPRG